jgi:hypothetical protein
MSLDKAPGGCRVLFIWGDTMPKSSKCWHYKAIVKTDPANCPNCLRWDKNKDRCRDQQLLIDKYKESGKFRKYDRMMRDNKGLRLE